MNILDGLRVSASIGIHPVERSEPQPVLVTVHLHCRYDAEPQDRIGAVVDYDFLRREIHDLVAERHFELQETFCEAIAALCLADPRVRRVRVRTVKTDIYPDARIGCEIVRAR